MTYSQKTQSENHWLVGLAMIASYLGFGKTKTSQFIKSERLKSYRVGNKVMARKTDIDSFIMFEKPYHKLTRPQKSIVNCNE